MPRLSHHCDRCASRHEQWQIRCGRENAEIRSPRPAACGARADPWSGRTPSAHGYCVDAEEPMTRFWLSADSYGRLALTSCLSAALAVAAGCKSKSSGPADVILIAVVMPITGREAKPGQ